MRKLQQQPVGCNNNPNTVKSEKLDQPRTRAGSWLIRRYAVDRRIADAVALVAAIEVAASAESCQ
jgi:hypothetical protein